MEKQAELKLLGNLQTAKFVDKVLIGAKVKEASHSEIISRIGKCIAMVGIAPENVPQDEERLVLIEFVADNFKGFHLNEITTAFSMMLCGALTERKVEHYGKFTCEYFGAVMNNYKLYRSRELKRLSSAPRKNVFLTKKEKRKKFVNSVVTRLKAFIEDDLSSFNDEGNSVYNSFVKLGFIDITLERKKKIYERCRVLYISEQKEYKSVKPNETKRINNLIRASSKGYGNERIKSMAKTMALNQFLKDCKEFDRDIITEFKEKYNE